MFSEGKAGQASGLPPVGGLPYGVFDAQIISRQPSDGRAPGHWHSSVWKLSLAVGRNVLKQDGLMEGILNDRPVSLEHTRH